jgi:diketogulonate reductase-like aldo/keto reductase
VALRWLLQQEAVAAIPRTSRPERLRSNLSVFDFELSETEMQTIDTLGAKDGRLIDPHFAPAWD